MLPRQEWQKVIHAFNATRVDFPLEKLIHQLFEQRVEAAPGALAIVSEEHSLTFDMLNREANQLARQLRRRGVGPERLVAVYVHRSVDMVVGLLAVLKAGGAYVPLDPTNPEERLRHVLADADPAVVLTQAALASTLPQTAAQIVQLDADRDSISAESGRNLEAGSPPLHSRNLAYVIYTSGSTGRPKGVSVEHRSVVNYALHAIRQFDVSGGDGSLISTSFGFDLMLTGLYPTLLAGRTVRLCPERHGVPDLERALLRCRNLAPLKITPSHVGLVENALQSGRLKGRVRALVLGGEPLHASTVRLWREHAPDTRLFNHYGPTEATVGCIVEEIDAEICGAVPIGRPIANTQVYILDDALEPVPIAVAGALYVGGAGVARGYWRRPELTQERFIPDPFSDDPQARLYRTGDGAKWRADGKVEYLGRSDDQVKIRGFRIELGEIEAQLRRHACVGEAAVIVREDRRGEKQLAAYVVAHGAAPRSQPHFVAQLRDYLKTQLPDYMIPLSWTVLSRLPLTPNGKVDRRALSV